MLVVVLAACGRLGFGTQPEDARGTTADDGDAPRDVVDGAASIDGAAVADAALDAPPGAFCGGTFAHVCIASAPTVVVNLNGQAIDTDGTAICTPLVGGSTIDACVVAGMSVQINGTVRATGSRPLVLLSSGTVLIAGTLDLSGGGANSNPSACGPAGNGGQLAGGAGGSYASTGGAGGRGTVSMANPDPALPLTTLHGGCNGGDGSQSTAAGGGAGGAVDLIGMQIAVGGSINASGAGGQGGAIAQGGAGGGSGGLVVLDSVSINVSGSVIAQGGGGGAGGGTVGSGKSGEDPTTVGVAAPGGTEGSGGGSGGSGGVAGAGQDGAASVSFGAGGGGGSTGFVHATSSPMGAIRISPPPS